MKNKIKIGLYINNSYSYREKGIDDSSKDKKNNNGKKEKKFGLSFVLKLLTVIGLVCFVALQGYNYYAEDQEKEKQRLEQEEIIRKNQLEKERKAKLISNAKKEVKLLYQDNIPKAGITEEELVGTENTINLVEDTKEKENLTIELNEIKQYRNFYNLYKEIYIDKILISNYDENTFNDFLMSYDNLKQEWKEIYASDIVDIKMQKEQIENAYNAVSLLFLNSAMTKVKTNVTRKQYENAVNTVSVLKQENLKQNYNTKLNNVLKKIEEREAYLKRQEEIKNAWVVLNTPYVSQNQAEIYNGCEGASLLMASQYKGYLKGKILADVALAMPKSDDPHEGFYLDIYGTEPKTESHWIAPDALAKFGRSYTGNSKITDSTGYSFSQLEQELTKGNPVIIYVTGGELNDPVWIEGQEVPVNLHVILLVGYNGITKQVIVKDPWTHNESSKYKYYPESRITSIYNQVGKKSVIVG